MEAKCGRVEATIFRLLLGILDIVPPRGKGTGLKTRLYKGKRATARIGGATGGQLPAGAWSHLMARRQGAESLLRIGVFSQTIKL